MSDINIDNACSISAVEPVGTTSLEAASCNLAYLDRLVNSGTLTETNRVGSVRDTVQGALNKLGVIIGDPIPDWQAGISITQLEARRYPATTGDVYIPVKPLPFVTGAVFNTDDWAIYQGLNEGDFSQLLIDDVSQAYEFNTTLLMTSSLIVFLEDKTLKTKGDLSVNDGLGSTYLVKPPQALGDKDLTLANGYIAVWKSSASSASSSIIEIESTIDGIKSDLGDVAIAASESDVSFTNLTSIVNAPSTDNKANPDIADAPETNDATVTPLVNPADFLHRLRNTGTGATSVQSPSTLGSFAVSPKWNVIPSTQYTISMHGAPLGFEFYQITSQIQCFDVDGEWLANISPTSVSADEREATFTIPSSPVGIAKIAINLRNPDEFSNTNPLTASSFSSCINNIMLSLGASDKDFVPYSNGDFMPTTDLFDPIPLGALRVTKQNTFFYVRAPAQQSTDKDVVWRLLVNHGENPGAIESRTGVVDFYGERFIDRSSTDTKAAFNQSPLVQNNGGDESCPIRYNEMFQAGGHGAVCYQAFMVAHGKTNVDVGSVWSDGTDQWVLYYINNTDGVSLMRRNTGSTDKWVITSANFGSLILTHVSGATNTANIVMTSSEQYQNIPIIRDYLVEFRVDNAPIDNDGDYVGQRAVLSETYALMNIASQQDWLISDVGNSTPDYINEAISEQVRFYYEFEWNEFGAMSVRAAHAAKEDYRRQAGNGYWGAQQMQRLSLVGDSIAGMHNKVFVYIPEVAPVDGLDFENIAEVTTNILDVVVPVTSCDDVSDPASHYCLIGKDSSDTILSRQLFGYSRLEGLGVPATRANSVNIVYNMTTSEKNYPHAIDSARGDAVSGETDTITCFRAPGLPTDPDLTVPGDIVTMTGKTFCYITAHQNLTGKQVAIPNKFNGWPVTITKASANVTVKSEFVSEGVIEIDVINGYGDVVLMLGA